MLTGKESDAIERMAMIAAFAVSGYSSAYYRTHKPFNPLHGETFDCVREDKGFRFISEQVSIVYGSVENYTLCEYLIYDVYDKRYPITHP